MAKGKGKGSQFEREIAKYLTQWASGQSKDYWYWRSPGSGSIATRTMLNEEVAGDIIPLKPEARFLTDLFSIELKNGYPSSSFHKWVKPTKAEDEITKFWKQTLDGADKGGKRGMLIYKKKGEPPLVGVAFPLVNLRYVSLNFLDLPQLFFYNMDMFFEFMTPENMTKIVKRKKV